jgi:hypothetical protein
MMEQSSKWGSTKPKLPDYDYVLEGIFKEAAEEMGIEASTVKEVYTHFTKHLASKMSEIRYRSLTKEKVREIAINFYIPGFGRILNKYGKSRNKKSKITKVKDV